MKQKKYPREALKVGLKKDDIDLIRAIEDYSRPEIDEMILQIGLPSDESVINKVLNGGG